ncbi:immunoglobulin-like domain-containing protein, partial [Vibrio parahaemolyticus]
GNPVDTKTGVTVELSNGKTITIDANSSSKSLTIDAETDDVYVDAKDVSVSIKDVIETNKGAENSFEKLVADKTPVDTKVTDTEDTVT